MPFPQIAAHLLLVGLGGAIGSVARFLVGLGVSRLMPAGGPSFPYATLAVNVAGCFAIGLFVPGLGPHGPDAPGPSVQARLFLVTGVLGGFTTFSAFGLETCGLLRDGRLAAAAINIVASVGLGLGAVALGARLGR